MKWFRWLRWIWDAMGSPWAQVVLWTYVLVTFTINHFDDGDLLWDGGMVVWAGGLLVVSLLKIRRRREDKIDDAIRRLGGDDKLFPEEIQQPRPSQTMK